MRVLPSALIISMAAFSFAQALSPPPTLSKGTLKIAVEGTYAPFTFKDAQGNLTGFDVDVARALAAKLGLQPEFVLTEWSGILAGLQANKYDVIINQVGITAERQKSIGFSDPYVYSRPQIAVHSTKGQDYATLADLKGKRVGVGLGTVFEKDLRDAGGITVVTYPGTPEYLADLAQRSPGRHLQRPPPHRLPRQVSGPADQGRGCSRVGGQHGCGDEEDQCAAQAGGQRGPQGDEGRRHDGPHRPAVVRAGRQQALIVTPEAGAGPPGPPLLLFEVWPLKNVCGFMGMLTLAADGC